MYFRPTFAMERAIARLPARRGPLRPAFLLGTCGGEPGAHFAICAEQLRHKGWAAVAATWVLAPSNWPVHLHAVEALERTTPVGTWLNQVYRPARLLWGTVWPFSLLPDEGDRRALDAWLAALVSRVETRGAAGAPAPSKLHVCAPGTGVTGRAFPREDVVGNMGLRIDGGRCTACGTCVAVCPVEAIAPPDAGEPPRFVAGCTGCWACVNCCPEGAIAAIGAPIGARRYAGPPRAMRELFSRPRPAR
jgi:NAD-dependent dihydropyrimidine dehydrogenase PreA subunit